MISPILKTLLFNTLSSHILLAKGIEIDKFKVEVEKPKVQWGTSRGELND